MAGYQVQNQNFFVNLNQGDVAESQIAFLQDTYLNPTYAFTGIFVGGNATQGTGYVFTGVAGSSLNSTGNHVVGAFFGFTGAGAAATATGSIYLPTAGQALACLREEIAMQLGNQILNVPATQRAYLTTPPIGSSFQFTIFNGTTGFANLDVLDSPASSVASGAFVKPSQTAIVTGIVVDNTLAASPSVTYVVNAN